ncbi:MAG TPA: cytochrome P450 [Micromonosporaceae bacterium]
MTAPVRDSADLPDYPIPRECPYRPSADFAPLREQGPLTKVRLYNGRIAWLVTGPAEARALLADERTSIKPDQPNFPLLNEEMEKVVETGYAAVLFGADPPEHTRQRRMLTQSFTVRRIAEFRPDIERIVAEQLDAMERHGPPVDLVAALAQPIPTFAACVLLGVPYVDREDFGKPARELFEPELADQAMVELSGYLDRLIQDKETNPGNGLLDDLIAAHVRTGELSRAELISLTMAILIAGTETTTNVISLGTLALLEHREQFEALCADPELVPGAVEELLRYVSLVEAFARVATADIEIAGEVIRAGDGILVSSAGANFSEALVANPHALDVHRPTRHHLAFGHGIHLCIGHNLARLELEIVFRGLVERFPTLRSALPIEEIPKKSDGTVERLVEFPVTW